MQSPPALATPFKIHPIFLSSSILCYVLIYFFSLLESPRSGSELVGEGHLAISGDMFGGQNGGKWACCWHLLCRGKELSSQNVNSAQTDKPCAGQTKRWSYLKALCPLVPPNLCPTTFLSSASLPPTICLLMSNTLARLSSSICLL